jgi:hypothetical protein
MFPRRIIPAMSRMRVPQRYFSDKKMVQSDRDRKDENRILEVLLLGSIGGGTFFGYQEFMQTYDNNRSFGERVLAITASTLTGIGIGGIAVLTAPVIVPIAMVVGIICYINPPPPPDTPAAVRHLYH